METVQSQTQAPAGQYTSGTDFQADFPSQAQTQYSETERTQTFPVQSQVVRQTTVVPVHVVQGRGSQPNSQPSEVGGRVLITILRVISSVFCTGALVAASIALSAINNAENLAMEQGFVYENASSYRGAAGWLVFACCAALIYHAVMITIQILYFKCSSIKHFKEYLFINSIFLILFILALLAGGIVNGVFAFENFDRDFDVCSLHFSNSNGDEFCDSLERVSGAEIASAVLSVASIMPMIMLFCIILCVGVASVSNNQHLSSQPQGAAPYQPTLVTTHIPPSVQPSAPPSAQPSAPPSYASVNPPSYDSVTTPAYTKS